MHPSYRDVGGLTPRHPLHRLSVGLAIHRVIQDALDAGLRHADTDALHAFVRDHQALRLPLTHRLARFALIFPAVRAYFTELAAPASWLYIGNEEPLGRRRADVLWLDERGRYWIDELKTGETVTPRSAVLIRQVSALAAEAGLALGGRAAGIRVLHVQSPERSWTQLIGSSNTELTP